MIKTKKISKSTSRSKFITRKNKSRKNKKQTGGLQEYLRPWSATPLPAAGKPNPSSRIRLYRNRRGDNNYIIVPNNESILVYRRTLKKTGLKSGKRRA